MRSPSSLPDRQPRRLRRTQESVCLFACFLLLLGWKGTIHGEDRLTLGQARLGNVFVQGETVELSVQTTGDSVEWTVRDFYGSISSGGPISLSAARREAARQTGATKPGAPGGEQTFSIRPATANHLGYFELHVTAKHSGHEVAHADTTFAVVTPINFEMHADSPFGVMTHFAQGWDTDLMPLIARAGLIQIRDEQYWQQIEPQRGRYVFNDRYRAYMAAAAANGLYPLIALTFDNNQYDHDPAVPGSAWAPCTDNGRTGYANYGAAVLAQYPAAISTVEIWNEYNGTWCSGPANSDRPLFYTRMLQTAYQRLKQQPHNVRVLGGAAILTPLPWFEDLFKAGALDSMDAVAVHPYVGIPEDAEADMTSLQDLMASFNHGHGPKPIWATECGAPDEGHPGRQEMARYLVRLLTVLRSTGVERIYWYLMRDYACFVTGLLHADNDSLGRYVPTAAYPAYANLIRQLHDARFVRREATDLRTRAYLFDKSGVPLRVLWSTDSPAHLLLATHNPLTVTDIMGDLHVLDPQDKGISLLVDNNPVYVHGEVDGIRETGRDLLLADSVAGFSGTQGTAPGTWSYGYYHAGDSEKYRPADFKPMTWTRNTWGCQWQCQYGNVAIGKTGAHPGDSDYKQVWSIRRWQSNTDGPVRINGSVNRSSDSGDGTGVKILVDGEEIYSRRIGGKGEAKSASLNFGAVLKRGSMVDFVTTPGPADDMNFDAVDYRVQITQSGVSAPAH